MTGYAGAGKGLSDHFLFQCPCVEDHITSDGMPLGGVTVITAPENQLDIWWSEWANLYDTDDLRRLRNEMKDVAVMDTRLLNR